MNQLLAPYTAPVTRKSPTLIVYCLDMSGSMAEDTIYEGEIMPKCNVVSRIVNIMLQELIYKCRRGDGYNDYLRIIVLGYNGSGVSSLLENYSKGKLYTTVQDLVNADCPKISYNKSYNIDGVAITDKYNVKSWVDIKSFDTTPMYSCLEQAYDIINQWCKGDGNDSFPPIVINITDGESTDASESELIRIADKIKFTKTSNGNTLFVNIHITPSSDEKQIIFPNNIEILKDIKLGQTLFKMSSEVPDILKDSLSEIIGVAKSKTMRAMGYNSSMKALFDLIQIGSISISR